MGVLNGSQGSDPAFPRERPAKATKTGEPWSERCAVHDCKPRAQKALATCFQDNKHLMILASTFGMGGARRPF